MKKSKKIKIGVAILTPVMITCVVGGVGYSHYNKYIKQNSNQLPDGEQYDKEKPIEDRIDEDKSQETKKEFDKIKEEQPKPSDIVIPDDATEKDKEQLGVAKQYLTIFNSVNNVYKASLKEKNPDKFALSEITDIYLDNGAYIFNLDVVKETNGKYYHSNVLLKVSCDIVNSIDDLATKSEKFTRGTIKYEFDSYLSNQEMNSKLFHDTNPNGEVILDTVLFTSGDMAETPIQSNVLVKEGNEYTIINLYYWGHSIGKTYEEMQSEILSQKSYAYQNVLDSYSKTSIDWQSFLKEYKAYQQSQQEAQAQAEIEEISTRDENGKVTGMDWDESQEKVEKKKAQNAAKLASQDAAMDYMPLYSDQELSL